ncbi:hypothetical protein Y032_0158g3248 [Ancylostoma ceylanicum]|nr:hypothetical protein Y032_0158g3248 [Ancylostoma ceylanicum]
MACVIGYPIHYVTVRDAGCKSWFVNLVSLGFTSMNPSPGCMLHLPRQREITMVSVLARVSAQQIRCLGAADNQSGPRALPLVVYDRLELAVTDLGLESGIFKSTKFTNIKPSLYLLLQCFEECWWGDFVCNYDRRGIGWPIGWFDRRQ